MEKRPGMLTAAGILNIIAGAFGIYVGINIDPLKMLIFFNKLVMLSGFEPILLVKVFHAFARAHPILPPKE